MAHSVNRASNGAATDRQDDVSGSPATEKVSRFDGSQALPGANITDEEALKAVCVAVFAQESGKVWGNASLTLHDAMDDCLEAGQVLIAIPSCEEHQSAYSIREADHANAIARRLLC